MSVKELIKRNVVAPALSQKFTSAMGEVLSIDYKRNTATVEVNNQFGEGTFVIEKAHISLIGNGIHLKGIRVGDYVMVDFTGGMLNNAKISSVLYHCYDNVKEEENHFIQSFRFDTKEKFLDIIKTRRNLLFDGNEIELNDIDSPNFEDEYLECRNKIGSYGYDEIGITHPISKATIKFEEDGTIMLSNSNTNTITLKPNGEILINSKEINITSNGNVNIDTPKDINLNCANFNVNEKS